MNRGDRDRVDCDRDRRSALSRFEVIDRDQSNLNKKKQGMESNW